MALALLVDDLRAHAVARRPLDMDLLVIVVVGQMLAVHQRTPTIRASAQIDSGACPAPASSLGSINTPSIRTAM